MIVAYVIEMMIRMGRLVQSLHIFFIRMYCCFNEIQVLSFILIYQCVFYSQENFLFILDLCPTLYLLLDFADL